MSDKLSNISIDGDNNIIIETGDNSNVTISSVLIKINMIPVYDSNDDAKLDGLTEGFLYRTSNGDLKVVF